MVRREYGSGSVYRRSRDGRWVGTLEAGWAASGRRRRITVTGKTEAAVRRRLRDRRLELERGGGGDRRITVKAWSDEWLEITQRTLTPKSWGTNRGQVRNWVVPTIGHVRLAEVTHADLRAVAAAQRAAGQAALSIARCRSTMLKMLKDAVAEGHTVPSAVIATQPRAKRKGKKKDREGLELEEAAAVLGQARATLPHCSRWEIAFLQGLRQAEALGLTWDAVDLQAATLSITWQLQALPYNVPYDRTSGFRVPDDYEAVHLVDAFHLVRPKTEAGERVIPLVPWAIESLATWRERSGSNPYGLVWARPNGRPVSKSDDLAEWKALQEAAGVRHHSGRPYVAHEIRNTTATLLMEAGIDSFIITAILGHTNIETSRGYMTKRAQQARPAMEAVASALGLALPGPPCDEA